MKIINVFTVCFLIEISYQTTVTNKLESNFLNNNTTAVSSEISSLNISVDCLSSEDSEEILNAMKKSSDDLCKREQSMIGNLSSTMTANSSSEVKSEEVFVPTFQLNSEDKLSKGVDSDDITDELIAQEDTTTTDEDTTEEITEETSEGTEESTVEEDTTTEESTEMTTIDPGEC